MHTSDNPLKWYQLIGASNAIDRRCGNDPVQPSHLLLALVNLDL